MGAVVIDISMSLGGFITGPNEGIEHPLGEDDGRLHDCPSGFSTWESEPVWLSPASSQILASACATTSPESRRRPQLSPFVDAPAAAAAAY
jgi:hypothetical protein